MTLYESTKHCTKDSTYYSVKLITYHKGYRNLMRIARKHNKISLWIKYRMLSIEHKTTTTINLQSLNHTRLKNIPVLLFRNEFNWLLSTKLLSS